ncbi:uncharacterized protein MONBRDRAFT_36989 [Monosiga brevicollis MX1]|uniref:Uncharacterized protein n=1 Tax=Monosiga brevicollis TaxID=81824 RepID=A9UYV4_MONBE|nr:uncharacterized protein MONBRDRAFT_36989 [Monosiga brevicollis MX1]EDQ89673.1 predicted protein [Monosiga brevicollis MX1]|eukprot:XP_001745702.1 hypothetical protein [Monosiga brevicollis MX1]
MDTRSSVKAWQKPAHLDEATRLVALVRGRFPREDLPEHREEIRQKFLNEKPILNFPFLPPPVAEADSDSEGVIESAEPHSRPKCATQPLNVDLGPTMQAGQRNMAVPRRAKVDRFCFKAMLADKALQSCRNAHQPDTRAPRSAKAVFQGELKTSPISIKHDTSEPLALADDMDRAIDRLDAVHTRVIGHLTKLEDVRLLGFEREGVKELRAAVQAEVNLNAKRGRRSNSLPSYSLESYMAAYGLHPQYKTMSSKPKSVHQLLADI